MRLSGPAKPMGLGVIVIGLIALFFGGDIGSLLNLVGGGVVAGTTTSATAESYVPTPAEEELAEGHGHEADRHAPLDPRRRGRRQLGSPGRGLLPPPRPTHGRHGSEASTSRARRLATRQAHLGTSPARAGAVGLARAEGRPGGRTDREGLPGLA